VSSRARIRGSNRISTRRRSRWRCWSKSVASALRSSPRSGLNRIVRVAGRLVQEGRHTLYPRAAQNAGPKRMRLGQPLAPVLGAIIVRQKRFVEFGTQVQFQLQAASRPGAAYPAWQGSGPKATDIAVQQAVVGSVWKRDRQNARRPQRSAASPRHRLDARVMCPAIAAPHRCDRSARKRPPVLTRDR
jgi:hypothetical protein